MNIRRQSLTNDDVARLVARRFAETGIPMNYADVLAIPGAKGISLFDTLKFQEGDKGYCKYCYESHRRWHISDEHFPPCWICERCRHATLDRHMAAN